VAEENPAKAAPKDDGSSASDKAVIDKAVETKFSAQIPLHYAVLSQEENKAYYAGENRKEDLRAKRDYNEARRKYAKLTFILTCCWLGAMLVIVFLQGFEKLSIRALPYPGAVPSLSFDFELSEGVMIALITTTTLNVITYFTIVLHNLFPSDPPRNIFGKIKKQD
jgi:hypothetical protein